MFVWIGCALPQTFAAPLRSRCLALNEALGLDVSGFTLPQHISLKISFDAGDRYPEILDAVEALLRRETPFAVSPQKIQQQGGILWLSFRESGTLQALHELLDQQLRTRFGIGQHPFDRDFRFHSTLFLGAPERVALAADALGEYPLPTQLPIDTFLLGLSESGKSGTYRVVRTVEV